MKSCFLKKSFIEKKHGKKHFFIVEKAKEKLLLKICYVFFLRKENTVMLRACFCLGDVLPFPISYRPGFISVNFDNIIDQW